MQTRSTYLIKVTDKELTMLLRGLGSLLDPTKVKIRGEERQFVKDLNESLLKSTINNLEQSKLAMEKRLAIAAEFAVEET